VTGLEDGELHNAGARWRARQTDPVVDVDAATVTARSRRVLVAAFVALIVLVPAVAVIATRTNTVLPKTGPSVNVGPPVTTPSTPTREPQGPDVITLGLAIERPLLLAVDGTHLWVTGYAPNAGTVAGQPAHLQKIDTTTGKVLGDVTLPDDEPIAMQVGDGAVWVTADQAGDRTELLKVDIATMRVTARIAMQQEGKVAVGPDAVWLTDRAGLLRRIDPSTARVVATINLARYGAYPPTWVSTGPLGVFVSNDANGTIRRIDATTNKAGPEIPIADTTVQFLEANGSLWVESGDGLGLIEITRGTTPQPPIRFVQYAYGLAFDGHDFWFGTTGEHVLRADPVTRAVSYVSTPAGTRANVVAADPQTGEVWAASASPTPKLFRIPTEGPASTPTTTPTTVSRCGNADECPPPPPIPCPPNATVPSFTNTFCGPAPGPGNGLGPSGQCRGSETVPPCGPGMIPRHYYAYTLPGSCDGKLILNGQHWLSALPPPTNGPVMNVWVAVQPDGKHAGFIGPNGAVGFEPDTGQPVTGRSGSCP
jgi:hypothetical protein